MATKGDRYGARYWSEVARRMEDRHYLDEFLCEQKRNVHLDLIWTWANIASSGRISKTGLFEEALENKRTKYLAGLYIAVKAVKREKP